MQHGETFNMTFLSRLLLSEQVKRCMYHFIGGPLWPVLCIPNCGNVEYSNKRNYAQVPTALEACQPSVVDTAAIGLLGVPSTRKMRPVDSSQQILSYVNVVALIRYPDLHYPAMERLHKWESS